MSAKPELMRQGTQRPGPGYTIGFISASLRESSEGGGLAARFGIASKSGRAAHTLAEGESVALPDGGTLRVLNIFVSPDGLETAAAIEVTGDPRHPSQSPQPTQAGA